MFEPVKTGIAGEKYFEIASGLKEGDNVIVGPFASVRTLADGAAVKVEQAPRCDWPDSEMTYFLESATIALQAIWANKLRSFLTVLGNIVAVTSIIAVVSLIQGMNAYVSDTIVSGVGADNFTIQRMPIVRTEADEERVRNNPRITVSEASAVRRFSENVGAVAAQSQSNASLSFGNETVDGVQVRGVTRDYIYFSTFDVERGRLMSPAEVDSSRPVTVIGWDIADKLFGPVDPLDKMVKIGPLHHRIVGIAKKKGSAFGNSQDNFAVVPYGTFRKMFGSRTVRGAAAGPAEVARARAGGDGRRHGGDANRAPVAAERAGQLRDVLLRHAARHLPDGNRAAFLPFSSASSRCRSWSAAS